MVYFYLIQYIQNRISTCSQYFTCYCLDPSHYFSHAIALKSSVYFILVAHLSLGQLHFTISIAMWQLALDSAGLKMSPYFCGILLHLKTWVFFFFFSCSEIGVPFEFQICVFLYSVDKYNYNLFCHFSPYIFSHCLSAWSFELMPLSLNSPFMFSSSFYSERFHQIHLQPFYSFFFFSFCYIFNASSHIFNFQWFFWFSGVLFHSHVFLFCRYKTLDLRILTDFLKFSPFSGPFSLGFMLVFPCVMLICCLLILGFIRVYEWNAQLTSTRSHDGSSLGRRVLLHIIWPLACIRAVMVADGDLSSWELAPPYTPSLTRCQKFKRVSLYGTSTLRRSPAFSRRLTSSLWIALFGLINV